MYQYLNVKIYTSNILHLNARKRVVVRYLYIFYSLRLWDLLLKNLIKQDDDLILPYILKSFENSLHSITNKKYYTLCKMYSLYLAVADL